MSAHLIDYGDVDETTGKPIATAYQPCSNTGMGMMPGMIPGLPPGIQFPPQ